MFARRRLAQHSTDATSVPDPDSTPVATPKERPLPLRISDWLFEPVHSSSLGAFRIILALNMLMQNVMFDDMFVNHQRSLTVFPYPGFGWVTAPTPTTGQFLLNANFGALIFLMLGCCTRVASAINFLTFFWLFQICESYHNNHYILLCQVTFVSMFLDLGRWFSVDTAVRNYFLKKRSSPLLSVYVPRYNLFLMQVMMVIPYVGGAIAKINWDWLCRCQPPIEWFKRRPGFPYNVPGYPCFVSWGGFVFDAVIGLIIFHKKWRYYLGIPGVAFFNIMNKFMFNIGIFPILMLTSLLLFFDPDLPQNALDLLMKPALGHQGPGQALPLSASDISETSEPTRQTFTAVHGWKRRTVTGLICVFFIYHVGWPLRHWLLYEGSPSWSEEGHFASWHMMLRTKAGYVMLEARVKNDRGQRAIYAWDPEQDPLLSGKQKRKVANRPHVLLLYAKAWARVFNEANLELEELRAHSCFQLNGRPAQPLYIPTANLLQYASGYEGLGATGMRKFLYPLDDLSTGPSPEHVQECATTHAMFRKFSLTPRLRIPQAALPPVTQEQHDFLNRMQALPVQDIMNVTGFTFQPGIVKPRFHSHKREGKRHDQKHNQHTLKAYVALMKTVEGGERYPAYFWLSHYRDLPHRNPGKCKFCE